MNYDLIGDIHGHAKELKRLLLKLGYRKLGNTYRSNERKVIFLGDYIDRGGEEETVCNIIRNMVDSGDALAIMGNHEYNAICYATKSDNGYLRKHSERNRTQHQAFLDEFTFNSKKHKDTINWFKTLPLMIENDKFRVIHACWHNPSIKILKEGLNSDYTLNDNFLFKSANNETKEFKALESCLKGLEMVLPNNFHWDNNGLKRNTMRLNWFKRQENRTLRNIGLSMPKNVELPEVEIDEYFIYEDNIPLFIGHYWMQGIPSKQTDYIACLDYSVAKGGKLVSYRYDGEDKIDNKKFFF